MLAGAVVLVVSAGIGSLVWVTALASVVAVVRRAAGDRALRTADAIAGAGLLGFGGALAYGAPRSDG
jgi:predicted metal-binding membrane protein